MNDCVFFTDKYIHMRDSLSVCVCVYYDRITAQMQKLPAYSDR